MVVNVEKQHSMNSDVYIIAYSQGKVTKSLYFLFKNREYSKEVQHRFVEDLFMNVVKSTSSQAQFLQVIKLRLRDLCCNNFLDILLQYYFIC